MLGPSAREPCRPTPKTSNETGQTVAIGACALLQSAEEAFRLAHGGGKASSHAAAGRWDTNATDKSDLRGKRTRMHALR